MAHHIDAAAHERGRDRAGADVDAADELARADVGLGDQTVSQLG